MSAQENEEAAALIAEMSPDIANFTRRMMASRAQSWEEFRSDRDELVKLNKGAVSDLDQSTLAFIFIGLWESAYEDGLIDPANEELKGLREGDYNLLLIVQSSDADGMINPDRMEQVTRREVEAGRMSPDDGFRELAVAGSQVLGMGPGPGKRKGWLGRLFGR